MSLPSGYVAWAHRQGCNPYHPLSWSPEDHAAFRAWKLEWFRDAMRAFKAFDMPRLMPREQMRSRIREALDRLQAPPPSRPYRQCPCHPFAPRRTAPITEPHGLSYIRSFRGGAA
jgi:hypothetical protein